MPWDDGRRHWVSRTAGAGSLLLLVFALMGATVACDVPAASPDLQDHATPPAPFSPAAFGKAPEAADTVVLIVSTGEEADELARALKHGGLVGVRGTYEIVVAVGTDDQAGLMLREMTLGNEDMCPVGSCGHVALIDLRALTAGAGHIQPR